MGHCMQRETARCIGRMSSSTRPPTTTNSAIAPLPSIAYFTLIFVCHQSQRSNPLRQHGLQGLTLRFVAALSWRVVACVQDGAYFPRIYFLNGEEEVDNSLYNHSGLPDYKYYYRYGVISAASP